VEGMMIVESRRILKARIEKSSVPTLYRRIAPKYDIWATLTESKARSRCLEAAAIKNGESVLEVAVGTGLAFAETLKMNPSGRNEGIDITDDMVIRAIKRAETLGVKNYRLSIGDAYDLEYDDDTFDVLVNNYMFDLLPETDFQGVLSEFKRVLRPGGRLVVVNMTKGEHWYNGIWEAVYRINPAALGGCRGVDLLPYIQSSGFNGVKREFISQLTFPSELVYAIKPR
jgi:ubiquinone/menaquinone biosynthesis C-methylase UbiE